ncbi:MFS transporter [Paenibacillus sp. strain BS8-2]
MIKLGLPMTARVWHNFRIDGSATLLFSMFNVVMNQFYIAFALQQGADKVQVGLLAAAPAIGLIFSPFWASWIERTGNPKPFVVLPNLIGRFLLLLPAFFPEPGIYVAAAIVFQLLMGIQAPAYAAFVSRMYPPETRGRLMGYVRVLMGVVMIPLAYLVGNWAEAYGPTGPLIAGSLLGVLSIIIFNALKLSKKKDSASPNDNDASQVAVDRSGQRRKRLNFNMKQQWMLVRDNRTLGVFLLATTFAGFGNMFASPLYQIIQVNVLELSNVQIGYARVAYFTALLLTFWIAGMMIDRFPIKYTLMVGIGAYAVVPMLYGVWGNYPSVLIGNAVQGIGEAIWDIGILAFVFRLVPGREAMVFGIHLMLFGIRGTLGPILGTTLTSSVSMSALLITASICGWIGTALFVWGNRGKSYNL